MNSQTFLLISVICALYGTNTIASELTSGEVIGRHIFGLARDYQQSPVMIGEDPLIHKGQVSHHEFVVAGEGGKQSYAVSLFNDSLGSAYLSERSADLDSYVDDSYVDTHALDLEPISGLTRPGSGIKSPWGSLLFSESTDLNTAAPEKFVEEMAPFFKGNKELVNPYHYGWLAEVILSEIAGETKVIKDYGVGRLAASQIMLMPDAQTLYLLDAEYSGNLYVFIAELAKSLTQGTLYGVLFDGRSVTYHKLGQGAALKTKFRLRNARFASFFDSEQADGGQCSQGFKYLESIYGQECLKLQKRAESYAGLFEPVRVMALQAGGESNKPVRAIEYDAVNQRLTLIQADQQQRTFPLKSDSTLQSQFIMESLP